MHNCFATKGRLLGALKNQGCLCTGLASTKGILPGVWYSGEDPMCVCVYVDNRWQLCVWIRIYHAHCVYMIYTFWQNACLFVCLLACLFVYCISSIYCMHIIISYRPAVLSLRWMWTEMVFCHVKSSWLWGEWGSTKSCGLVGLVHCDKCNKCTKWGL